MAYLCVPKTLFELLMRAQIINPLGRGASAGYRASGVWSLHKGTPARVSGSGTNFLLNRAS
jgi:hypothetical protein